MRKNRRRRESREVCALCTVQDDRPLVTVRAAAHFKVKAHRRCIGR